MREAIEFLGYLGALIIGICLFHSAIKFVLYLSKRSDNSDSKFLDFISKHTYGSFVIVILVLLLLYACSCVSLTSRLNA